MNVPSPPAWAETDLRVGRFKVPKTEFATAAYWPSARRSWTNVRTIRTFTAIALGLLRMLESMATPCSVNAYAQNAEDVVLRRVNSSVTKHFYDRGWRDIRSLISRRHPVWRRHS